MKFGFIPELIGRLPVIGPLNMLDKVALKKILTEPKNALIKQYKRLFEMDNISLEFDDDAIDEIVEQALIRRTGARGLRSIIESSMMDIMYEAPSKVDIDRCIITKSVIRDGSKPILKKRKKTA